MDDTPRAFFEELRSGILKKRVGQIALAVVLAEVIWRFVRALTWYLVVPLIGRFFQGQTESVLFRSSTARPMPWEDLSGSVLEFLFTIIVVFYLNRWIHKKPGNPLAEADAEYSSIGETVDSASQPSKTME